MKNRSSVYDYQEFRSIDCNACTTVCSNYMAYKGHMWNEHADEVLNGDLSIKPAPWKVAPMIQGVSGDL